MGRECAAAQLALLSTKPCCVGWLSTVRSTHPQFCRNHWCTRSVSRERGTLPLDVASWSADDTFEYRGEVGGCGALRLPDQAGVLFLRGHCMQLPIMVRSNAARTVVSRAHTPVAGPAFLFLLTCPACCASWCTPADVQLRVGMGPTRCHMWHPAACKGGGRSNVCKRAAAVPRRLACAILAQLAGHLPWR